MGEAKRKAARARDWQLSLNGDEQLVARAAQRTYERFVVPTRAMGMCYRLAFFLAIYLNREHRIAALPVIGYVHDGTGDLMTSHGWIDFNGKKTDISLTITEHPQAQLPGQLIVLDEVLREGHRYTYHREQTEPARQALEDLVRDPQWAPVVAHKEREHAMMMELADDPERAAAYLDAAPDGFSYARLAQIVGAQA